MSGPPDLSEAIAYFLKTRFTHERMGNAATVYRLSRIARGVVGTPKNLIFASNGPKPEIGFSDAINCPASGPMAQNWV